MKNRKMFAFVSSIIEIVLACVLFIVFLVVTINVIDNWINSYNNSFNSFLPSAIITLIVLFAFAVTFIIDGIISLKVSRAEDKNFEKFKNTFLVMGIVCLILAILALFTFEFMYYFAGVIFLLSFFVLIVVGIFKIMASIANANNQTAKGELNQSNIKNLQNKKQISVEDTLTKLQNLSYMYNEGLISSEEFQKIKSTILKENK